MQIRFSKKVTFICGTLVALMLRASYWQYERHQSKLVYIKTLSTRLQEPVVPILDLLSTIKGSTPSNYEALIHRRGKIEGSYDFAHEVVLRNRRLEGFPGAYVLTPLKLEGTELHILVNRGFIPLSLSTSERRKEFQKEKAASFIGLIKETSGQKFLSPSDPESGGDNPWVDAWLRVDTEQIQKQLPYPLIPLYLEIMESGEIKGVEEKIVSAKSGRDEMFLLPGDKGSIRSDSELPRNQSYPIPVFDTVVPPGRHQGYIYEWAGMAVVTFLIGLVLQLKRPQRQQINT